MIIELRGEPEDFKKLVQDILRSSKYISRDPGHPLYNLVKTSRISSKEMPIVRTTSSILLSFTMKTLKGPGMRMIKAFIYDLRDSYFNLEEKAEKDRDRYARIHLDAMRSDQGPDEWYDHLPVIEAKRHGEYNYDSPFYRSHGKRGRK